MMIDQRRRHPVSTVLMLTLGLVACGDGGLVGPVLDVSSQVDNFQFQGSSLGDLSETLSYNWEMTGTVAEVIHATVLAGGAATLILRDANGVEVYNRDLNVQGTFESAAGTAGRWEIAIVLANAGGIVRFGVQKKPDP
jgi:hypothetical protein